MQVHENHYIKRAGVAGIRARALPYIYLFIKIIMLFSVGTLVPAG
ncbi:putative membrane protein [Escherichia coli 7-233-03_S1_C2]|nr:putative membrane protein [Escherichia coli 7-233-03_S1_C2]KEN02900.1 putative membrane protein [Escherichia coli 7-233-03_S1_C3]KEO13292.1 putative membrane protein [Escherichia coli 8-415-05_S1_C2]